MKMIKTPQETADEILRNTSSVKSALNVVNKILKFTPYHKLIYHYWRVKLIFLKYKYVYGWQ
jgi:hypothetical protein